MLLDSLNFRHSKIVTIDSDSATEKIFLKTRLKNYNCYFGFCIENVFFYKSFVNKRQLITEEHGAKFHRNSKKYSLGCDEYDSDYFFIKNTLAINSMSLFISQETC